MILYLSVALRVGRKVLLGRAVVEVVPHGPTVDVDVWIPRYTMSHLALFKRVLFHHAPKL